MKKELKSKNVVRFFLIFLFGIFCSVNMLAQQGTIKGIVKDKSGEPIIGASVSVKGTTNGVATDVDGRFVLSNVKSGTTIVCSFITYVTQEIVLKNQSELIITLSEDDKVLDEVIVIGYGQVRKGDATGALTSVKADASVRGFAPNAQDMLTGKVAGVTITSEGGSPSGGASIRIRGGSSLTASNDPLIVVDGIFIDNQGLGGVGNVLSTINPTDIDSYTVLKDASATAIYGSRASNGVILITTKRGAHGKIKVTYDGNVSVSTPKNKIDVLTGDQFRSFINDTYSNLSTYNEMLGKLGTANTNWQDEILRTAVNTEHNISVYGSTKNLPYRFSFGYTNVNGILKTSNMERYTGSFSLNPTLFNDHLKINLNGRGMYINNRFADQNAIGAALVMDPSQSVYDENSPFGGFFTWTGSDDNIIQVATKNPLSMLEMVKDKSDVYNFIGNAQFDYKLHFFPDLHLNLNLGMDYSKSDGTKWISELSPSDYAYGGYDSSWDQKRRNSSIDFYAQYTKDLNFLDSKFDVMGGYAWQHYWREGSFIGHRITRYDQFGDPELVSESNYELEHYILSFFGRLNYSIKDKYLLTFTMRNDGSSRFSKDNRWSLFPSLALAWRVSEESFLKDIKAISNMKLRLGWGMTGQQEINQREYFYMPTYSHSVGDQANYLRGYNNGVPVWVSLLRPDSFNRNLKWETTITYNAGIDYGLFNNRIDGSIDVYHRKTKDLINAETKTTAGTNFQEYIASNIGNLENTGVEFAITGRPFASKDFTWEIGTNFAYNKNKITKLSAEDDKDAKRRVGMNVHMVGYAANMYYVYEQIYNEQGKPIEGFYKDQNNDGQINEQDLRPYKNPTPEWTLGLNTKLIWKAWDLSIAGHGSLGNYNYNAVAANNAGLSSTTVYANEFLSNRVSSAFNTNFQTGQSLSDYYVQDASFFRIDNVVLGWSFKQSKQFPFNGRIYGTVQNPFVFTKYDGLDPEVFGGYDGNVYPRPVTILLGVNLNF